MTEETPRPEILTFSGQQTAEAEGFPLLDLTKVLEEHKKTISMVFQPQGYKILLKTPSYQQILSLQQEHKEAMEKFRENREAMAAIAVKAPDDLSEEEQKLIAQLSSESFPFSLSCSLACIAEPRMTMAELQAWITTLAGNQIEALFLKVSELISPPGEEEMTVLKN